MWLMLQQEEPDDFVIATGSSYTLQEFIDTDFQELNLDWRGFVVLDKNLLRPTEITVSRANPIKAFEALKWKAKFEMRDIVNFMINEEKMKINAFKN